jgi:hypothetical protein
MGKRIFLWISVVHGLTSSNEHISVEVDKWLYSSVWILVVPLIETPMTRKFLVRTYISTEKAMVINGPFLSHQGNFPMYMISP